MIDPERPIPHYLVEKNNIVKLILFTSLFALVFINIYSPFNLERRFSLTQMEFLLYSSVVILAGVFIVVLSRIVMYHVCRKKVINLWQYLLWIFAEILFMALFYAIFEKLVIKDNRLFTDLVKLSARNTALVLLLPYALLWLYFSWRDTRDQMLRLTESQVSPANSREMIAFYDDKQILKLSLKKENLLYIESAENYVNICYLNKGKISKYLLRDTLKKMEENFSGTDIIRCHRSYIVNFENVKVIRKEKDGLMLDLDSLPAIDIPVSKTYIDSVMKTFSKYYRTTEL